jgi:hypothetical protein
MLTEVQEKPSQEKLSQVSSPAIENNAILTFLHLEFDKEGLFIQIKSIYPHPVDGKAPIQYFRINRYKKLFPEKDHVFAVNKYVDSFWVKIENNNGDFVIVEKS